MDVRQIREAKVLLPSAELDLTSADQPPARSDVIGIVARDADWSRLRLVERQLVDCRLTSVVLDGLHLEDTRVSNTTFTDCDLGSNRWNAVKIDRCVLSGSRLTGLQADGITLADVIIERCRLDYATLVGLNATGTVVFIDCTLRESSIEDSRLDGVVFADCPMPDTRFIRTRMRGADLRGSTINTITGITCLTGAITDHDQVPQLTQALLRELQLDVRRTTS
ncbi:pentapeptide repeat-containing protein [Actinomadura hibisca]|uniref:pentapeptide repeat-containing protein n=1 Tax=Actinomadura hibisca TaxID=68565 RepID=UPI00082ED385|nr:pentapeptide repeat-containing protein [Actinomadura hibisca]